MRRSAILIGSAATIARWPHGNINAATSSLFFAYLPVLLGEGVGRAVKEGCRASTVNLPRVAQGAGAAGSSTKEGLAACLEVPPA